MRVLQILHGWPAPSMGGTGLYVQALAQALAAQGHQVAVLAPRPEREHSGPPLAQVRPTQAGVEQIEILCSPPTRWEQSWRRPDLDAVLRGWLASWRPDVVHIHHLSHGSLGWLRAVRAEGRGLVLTLHDYALPCARGQLVDRNLEACPGPAAQRCAPCIAEQLALSPATLVAARLLAATPGLRQRARARLGTQPRPAATGRVQDRLDAVRAALTLPHRLLAPSRDLADRFEAMGLRRPELTDLPLVRSVSAAPPAPPGPVRVLFASSVIPTKGPDRLLRAYQALPAGQARLTIAGPSPAFDGRPDWADDLRRQVEATPGATWRGEVQQGEMDGLLADHDVLALPSTWPENSPLVAREASAAGLRLILPLEGGAGELVPQARGVSGQDDAGLLAALRAEVAAGRARVPPRAWPSAEAHALALSRDVYAGLEGPGHGYASR